MKTLLYSLFGSLLFLFCISCREDLVGKVTTGTITGKVVQKGTNTPIPNVKIFTSPTTQTIFTSADGTFKLENIPIGDYSLKAELTGYLSTFQGVNLKTGQSVSVIFELSDDDSLNSPPPIPLLLTPVDQAVDLPTSVNLTWNCTDPDKGDSLKLKFKIIVKNSLNNIVFEKENIKTKSYFLDNLIFGVTYFWQVVADDTVNTPVYSEIRQFKVSATPNNRFHYVRKSGSNYYIVSSTETGENFQLTPNSVNSWRPKLNNEAGLIAFLRTVSGNTQIFTTKKDGSDLRQVTTTQAVLGYNYEDLDFSWSTNGSELLYPSFNKLYKINKDGSGLTLVYTTTDGNFITECDWSNDGSKIALKTNDVNGYNAKIFVIDPLGNILTTVLTGQSGAAGGLNFSVTGNQLLYTRDISGYESANHRQLDSRILLYNLTTNTTVDLSSLSEKILGSNDLDPRFSPNDAEIIFMNTSNDGISEKNIYKITLTAEGTGYPRRLLFNTAEMPDWE
ncbi:MULTISPECIES: carboxypeptidase-like regulatory domain-containing protein [unclassified Kaistella]|uniref:carboxypeptidase-like regulatory domain-containing protein n=1 Tax=unclassified Kaistella TaxID=2762626 RepID=UPI002734990C|nr:MULTISPECIES: carboxypeptidase-like regulatory domain-containing protein [unclassified Kaistella]MDP2453900.1 carboxypeptidase-like regulatory domain-containing protein [Kaistella sp. SH11-4b]MDP2456957.1 carboxypeptidase-like regulatory domain-containing protein [Kaistella sp. SH40-3]MDP2459714.1 carboxypeptidase-like regulatory domain-containing protein [Kaistella sp. SH19-2b]